MEPIITSALIGAGSNLLGNIFGSSAQRSENMRIARYQTKAQNKLIDKMNEYNTPKNQMTRFQDAGLNPHLIYGQGSPGNQSSPGQAPNLQPVDYQSLMSNVGNVVGGLPMEISKLKLIDSQVQATNAKTEQTYAIRDLNRLQAKVVAANPLLDANGYDAILQGLYSTASLKRSEAEIRAQQRDFLVETKDGEAAKGMLKMQKEFELLDQRFNLGQLDSKLKAEVLTSKEFQNAILEVEKKFMTDFDITPKHILSFIQLLLMKSLSK